MVTLIIHLTVYMKVSTELFMLTPFFKTSLWFPELDLLTKGDTLVTILAQSVAVCLVDHSVVWWGGVAVARLATAHLYNWLVKPKCGQQNTPS